MFKEFFNNPTVKKVAKKAGVLAGAVVIEGIKGVAIKGATKAIVTSIDGGISGVKNLTLEDYVGRKNKTIDVPQIKSEEGIKLVVDNDRVSVDVDVDQKHD